MRKILVLFFLAGCHQGVPVTYTSAAVRNAACSAVAGANLAGTHPTKLTIEAPVMLASTSYGVASVSPIGERSPSGASKIVIEVDPSTVRCASLTAPKLFLGEGGELGTSSDAALPSIPAMQLPVSVPAAIPTTIPSSVPIPH